MDTDTKHHIDEAIVQLDSALLVLENQGQEEGDLWGDLYYHKQQLEALLEDPK